MVSTSYAVVMLSVASWVLESAGRLQPTVAVVDFSLARSDNVRCLRELRTRCPEVKLIVLSVHDEQSARHAALDAGADGFVLKRTIATDLLPAVDAVLAGQRYLG
jgi:two-component system secretion response regulator SsrB